MHDDSRLTMRIFLNKGAASRGFEERGSGVPSGGGPRAFSWLLLLALIIAGIPASACSGSGPEAAGTAVLEDADHSFALAFPADFMVTTDAKALSVKSYFPLDDGTVGGCYSGPDFAGTNFGSACIVAAVSPASERDGDCAYFDGDALCGEGQGVRDAVVNGLRFKRADMSDAAMGHRLEARDYWIIRDGRRYDIRLFVSHTDIGMYSPGEKREFSQEDCWAKLTGILNTFSFR